MMEHKPEARNTRHPFSPPSRRGFVAALAGATLVAATCSPAPAPARAYHLSTEEARLIDSLRLTVASGDETKCLDVLEAVLAIIRPLRKETAL